MNANYLRRRGVMSSPHVESSSGSIVTFDSSYTAKLKSLTVGIEPVQDLHGYDAPWPPGGGKNKLNPSAVTWKKWVLSSNNFKVASDSEASISYTINSETISVTTTSVYRGIGFAVESVNYDRVVSITNSSIGLVILYSAYEDNATVINSGASSCVIPANTSGFVAVRVNSASTVTFNIQLESGSIASSWSPYSNLCPISGWTGVDVTRCGKNMQRYKANAYIDATGSAVEQAGNILLQPIFVKNGQKLAMSVKSGQFGYAVFSDKALTTMTSRVGNAGTSAVYTASADCYIEMWMTDGTAHTSSDYASAFEPQVEFSASVTAYEPYSGTTLPITWTSAGTVYGGSDEIVEGKLIVDRRYVSNAELIEATPWENAGRGAFVAPSTFSMPSNASTSYVNPKLIATALKTGSQSGLYNNAETGVAQWWNNRFAISTGDTSINTVADFKLWLAENGSDIVYELATPQTYQLTAQELKTLLGQNNVWATTGDTSVEYWKWNPKSEVII